MSYKDKEKQKEYHREYNQRPEVKERAKEYYQKNKERIKERVKKYKQENKEEKRRKDRERYANMSPEKKEEKRRKRREWYVNMSPEEKEERRRKESKYQKERRNKNLREDRNYHSKKTHGFSYDEVRARQEYNCNLCKKSVHWVYWQMDHIISPTKGGTKKGDITNFQILCGNCNQFKNDKSMEEARELLIYHGAMKVGINGDLNVYKDKKRKREQQKQYKKKNYRKKRNEDAKKNYGFSYNEIRPRQDYDCNLCRKPTHWVYWNIDHIISPEKGGAEKGDITNFQILCANCNRFKGMKSMEETRELLIYYGAMNEENNVAEDLCSDPEVSSGR